MKLLSWMHRKSQKDSRSSFNGSVTGCSCVNLLGNLFPNNQGGHDVPSFNSNLKSKESYHFNSFCVENNEEFNQSENEEIFPGFLTIGTLSLESATPTFDSPRQGFIEDETPEIKYDLSLINEELEKFLKAEAEKEERDELPGEEGQATTLTLGEVKDEEVFHDAVKTYMYPLQGYLLGSTTEHTESRKKVKKEKKPSHKLSKSNRIMDTSPHEEDAKSKKPAAENIKKSSHVKNKMLQTPPPCPKAPKASTGCAAAPFLSLAKIKKLFHKKSHPEFGKAVKDPRKTEHENKNMVNQSSSKRSGTTSRMNGKFLYSMTDLKLPQDECNYPQNEMTGTGREHWIKTDAEYLVLEL